MKTVKIGVIGIALLTLSGCTAAQATAEPTKTPNIEVSGTISVPIDSQALFDANMKSGDSTADGDPCDADSGYDDIASGAQVVITDATNKTIATGTLNSGAIKAKDGDTIYTVRCEFPFTITDIPAGSKFYGVHVGNEKRGTQQVKAAEISDPINLTIG